MAYPGTDFQNRGSGTQHQHFQPQYTPSAPGYYDSNQQQYSNGYGQPPQQQQVYQGQPVFVQQPQGQPGQYGTYPQPGQPGQPTYIIVQQQPQYYNRRNQTDDAAEAGCLAALCLVCCCCCMPGPDQF